MKCRLAWNSVNLERGVIQLIPTKTRKHAHGQPVTIPIHPQLLTELQGNGERGTVFSLTSSLLPASRQACIPARLKRLDKYLAQGLITQEEHDIQRARILAEL